MEGLLWQLKGLEYSAKEGVAKPDDASKEWWVTVSKSDNKPLAELVVYGVKENSENEIPVQVKIGDRDHMYRVHRKSLQDVKQKLEEVVEKKP